MKNFNLENGYRRLDPTRGVEYVMDVSGQLGNGTTMRERLSFLRPFGEIEVLNRVHSDTSVAVNIIVPVSGVADRFRQFLVNYETTCLKSVKVQDTRLVVVVFSDTDAGYDQVVATLETLRKKHQRAIIRTVREKGKFSRARGLDTGAKAVGQNELMFFVDADLDFTDGFLQRCKKIAAYGEQAYFPVVFMLYNPDVVYNGKPVPKQVTISRSTGHWASYAFGMVCVYRKDYEAVGGFDLDIKGWGAEDVKLYERFVASSSIRSFRAVDPGLIHRFHSKACNPKLSSDQFRMCIGALAEGYASKTQLALLYLKGKT